LLLALTASLTWPASRDTTVASRVTISRDGIRIEGQSGSAGAGTRDRGSANITIDVDPDVPRSSGGSGEIVSFFRDVHVEPGRTVHGEVVALFGNARIEGEVVGDVVAVFGSIQLGDSARVGGDAVAIGGIDASPTAVVQGDLVSIPFFGLPGLSTWSLALGIFVLAIFAIVFGCLAAVVAPQRLTRVAETVSRRTLMSFFLGVLSLPLLLVLSALLCVTVIGIFMAGLLVILYPLFVFLGFAAAATLLGSRLRNAALEAPPIWASAGLGIAFNFVFLVLGGLLLAVTDSHGAIHAVGLGLLAVGLLLETLLSTLGTGALLLSGLGGKGSPAAESGTQVGQVPQPAAPA
jgi:hypothetical protein